MFILILKFYFQGSVVENMFSSQIISKNSKRFKEPEVGKGNYTVDKSF